MTIPHLPTGPVVQRPGDLDARRTPRISGVGATRPPVAPEWPTAYPRHSGVWTLRDHDNRWGSYDPTTGLTSPVHPAGDHALPALRGALARGTLVGYRVGRRAVIATATGYTKVVRPKRLDALISTHRWLGTVARIGETPAIVGLDPTGAIDLTRVPGGSLHRLLRDQAPQQVLDTAIDEIAASIAALHTTPAPPHLPPRSADEPGRWVDTIGRVDPDTGAALAAATTHLPSLPDSTTGVTHGDLHDKNVFFAPGHVSLIDLDSVAIGVPEDDVANLAVHLQLRSLQSSQPLTSGRKLATRLLERYREHRPLNAARLNAAAAHTWFRLACIYRFRASSRHLVPALLRQAVDHRE